jgi:hypothetical protein
MCGLSRLPVAGSPKKEETPTVRSACAWWFRYLSARSADPLRVVMVVEMSERLVHVQRRS